MEAAEATAEARFIGKDESLDEASKGDRGPTACSWCRCIAHCFGISLASRTVERKECTARAGAECVEFLLLSISHRYHLQVRRNWTQTF